MNYLALFSRFLFVCLVKGEDHEELFIYFQDIDRTLKDVLVNTITSDQIKYLLELLDIDEETKVDYKLFAGMAAYAERVLYPKFV